jgi:hypothetical protein
MAKKPVKAKSSAPAKKSAKRPAAKRPPRTDDMMSSSVLGGSTQDLIRSAFLKN